MNKALALLLALALTAGLFAGCAPKAEVKTGEFTYNSYTSSLGGSWNPHSLESSDSSPVLGYLETPFVDITIKDSAEQIYQWVYLAADSITDVTAAHQDDLTKYRVTLPQGKSAADMTADYVYEIKLNEKMKWENGTPINADSYIYSMQQLLNPRMRNCRAKQYYAGQSAVAGGLAYYNSGTPVYSPMVPAYAGTPDYSYDLDAGVAKGEVYLNLDAATTFSGSHTINSLNAQYLGGACDEQVALLAKDVNAYGYIQITADNFEAAKTLLGSCQSLFGITADDTQIMKEWFFINQGEVNEVVSYDAVGCYKVDDYTIRYVCQSALNINQFLTACTSNWLVYEDYYERGKDTSGKLVTTDYNSRVENTMSYGPYRIASLEAHKQMVLVQNENWYDWEKVNGQLVSFTDFPVDGKSVQQYQTTKIVLDVIRQPAAAKQAFLKGQLTHWSPEADDLVTYGTSNQMYKADQTYTMSFFFNTDESALKEMDRLKGNLNSVVLSNINFRKAMSLAVDRGDLVTATAGYTPAYAIMNDLYYYDVYNEPTSSYRKSDEAMQAICSLYGVKYGKGTPYASLADAYKSINGHNMTEAKALMAAACDELVQAGLYTKGEDIKINIAWTKGAMTTYDEAQVTKLEQYFNEAMKDSGFGKIDLIGVGNINDRYAAVPAGEFAIGWGAWGGAAFYPFSIFRLYCDTEQYQIHEAACWDPAVETLTLTVNGKEETMTWQAWSRSLTGSGKFADAGFEVKLQITADMEEAYLKKYYRIPICGPTVCSMLAHKVSYYTEDYNIMYGWGGLRLMQYNYNDAEWQAYIDSNNGQLSYE